MALIRIAAPASEPLTLADVPIDPIKAILIENE